jgi:hypothetical protein
VIPGGPSCRPLIFQFDHSPNLFAALKVFVLLNHHLRVHSMYRAPIFGRRELEHAFIMA